MHLFDEPWLADRSYATQARAERTWADCKLCTGAWNIPRTLQALKIHAREEHSDLID